MAAVGASLQKAKKRRALACRAHYQSLVQAEKDLALFAPKVEDVGKRLKSIWETNNMDTFLSIADERENGYLAERNVKVVVSGAVHIVKNDKVVPLSDDRDWFKLSEKLSIPKRPDWSFDLPAAELERREKASFLDWRRSLAGLEESHKVLLTPYEKNLEVWRQLWRVVERSDVLLEIIDARNPLAFRSVDFEKYVQTHKNKQGVTKEVIMLINKADLLTENQRRAWAAYFNARGERFYFFSAKPLDTTVDHAATELEDDKEEEPLNDVDADLARLEGASEAETDDETDEDERVQRMQRNKKEKPRHQSRKLRGAPLQYVNPYELEALRKQQKAAKNAPPPPKPSRPETKEEKLRNARIAEKIAQHQPFDVLSPEDLLDHLATFRAGRVSDVDVPLVVGMVGYPNVGKSSTINAILGCKKVVVSATPGKTKHFQTLQIPNERRVMLCDCPGLVFPSFASTREQMICDGVLPIDTVKDYVSPIAVVCQRIPRQVFEQFYKISLLIGDDVDESTSLADRLLNVAARRKGYMTDHDKPNRSKIAKEILKMYVDGVFVYANPPPGLSLDIPEDARALFTAELQGDVDDDDESEGDAWEDISDADEARALSDDGEDAGMDSEEEEMTAAPLMFFSRQRGTDPSQAELFNIERNMLIMQTKEKAPSKKKRTNHQLEPETGVFVGEDGVAELAIDSDDGIVEFDPSHMPRHVIQRQEKKPSKKAQRREAKRMGINLPTNQTTKVVGLPSTF